MFYDVGNLIKDLRDSEYIKERSYGDISSFNFTPGAFFGKVWDEQTTKARGLFIDTRRETIVARSYDKFFNIGEREETKLENLKNTLHFPVYAYEKENGYLGILSYNIAEHDFIFASKSSLDNDYANRFKDIFYETIPKKTLNRLAMYLMFTKTSLVFEVISPEDEPHIIEYPRRKIVLLDEIPNEINSSPRPYNHLKLIANQMGFECKKLRATLNTWEEFESFVNDTLNSIREVEGYVLVDSWDNMYKIKTKFYMTWKHLRTVAKRVDNDKEIPKQKWLTSPIINDFYNWLVAHKEIIHDKDIIALRRMFYGDMGEDYIGVY